MSCDRVGWRGSGDGRCDEPGQRVRHQRGRGLRDARAGRADREAAIKAVDHLLPSGSSTVGTHLDIRHLAATPPGLEVRARAELVEVEGRRLKFKVEAFDPSEKIGEGTHERFIVDLGRLIARAQAKVTG